MILALMLEDRAEAVLRAQILLGPNPRHGYSRCLRSLSLSGPKPASQACWCSSVRVRWVVLRNTRVMGIPQTLMSLPRLSAIFGLRLSLLLPRSEAPKIWPSLS